MEKLILYFKESYYELTQKVTWPTWQHLQNTTILVLIASVIIAAIIWGMDSISNMILTNIFYK